MNRFLLASAVSGLSMTFVASASRAETTIDDFVLRGFNADVTATSADACSSTVFYVDGNDAVLRGGSPSTPSKAAFLGYWTYNWCTATTSYGYSSAWDVPFTGNLHDASLSATSTLYNFSYSDDPAGESKEWTQTATVSVTWVGTGQVVPNHYGSNIQFPGLVWTSQTMWQLRPADAVLELSIDGVPVHFDSVSGQLSQSGWASVLLRHL
jgi:hypothetical protein